jgi:hypothetical protein
MSVELVEVVAADLYASGFRSLEDELAGIRRRIARGRERATDRDDLEELELALAELRASYRAALRVELEGAEERLGPQDVALVQIEELVADELPLRSIDPSTREALRQYREADYAAVLYKLADVRDHPVSA